MVVQPHLSPDVEPLLSTEVKVAIYRVCREAVHNALKHSGGGQIVVKIWCDNEFVRFSIEDDGRGFDVATALAGNEKGYSSLNDLCIYVESVGGQLTARSAADQGAEVAGWTPLANWNETSITGSSATHEHASEQHPELLQSLPP